MAEEKKYRYTGQFPQNIIFDAHLMIANPNSDQIHVLMQCIQKLSERPRVVIENLYLHHMKLKDVANALGLANRNLVYYYLDKGLFEIKQNACYIRSGSFDKDRWAADLELTETPLDMHTIKALQDVGLLTIRDILTYRIENKDPFLKKIPQIGKERRAFLYETVVEPWERRRKIIPNECDMYIHLAIADNAYRRLAVKNNLKQIRKPLRRFIEELGVYISIKSDSVPLP